MGGGATVGIIVATFATSMIGGPSGSAVLTPRVEQTACETSKKTRENFAPRHHKSNQTKEYMYKKPRAQEEAQRGKVNDATTEEVTLRQTCKRHIMQK